MTVVVGTDVYDTIANADIYHTARGDTDWVADTDANKEINCTKATDWLERNFLWRGTRKTGAQRLGWPRDAAYDNDDYLIGDTAAPWQVKEAMFIVAELYRLATYDLEGILSSDARSLKRTKVDVIEVEYDPGSRIAGADVVTHVIKMLRAVSLGTQGRLLRV